MSNQAPARPPSAPHNSSSSSANVPPSHSSPIDWTHFMNFQTPPVPSAGPAGNARQGGYSGGNGGQPGGGEHANGGDQYQAFAQGIAMNRPSPSSIQFQHPYPQQQPAPPSQYNQPSPRHPSLHLPQAPQAPSRSPGDRMPASNHTGNGKGKSPASAQDNLASQASQNDATTDGLTLDPAAFSRDIRFQVPSFLSNQMGGAPTFPPGGEAWSGFNGPSMFGTDQNGQQLTPGSLFGPAFGMTPGAEGHHGSYGANEPSGGGRNVLEGLSGFMSNEGGWDHWVGDPAKPDSHASQGTTFYVNPNPSANIARSNSQQVHHSQPLPNAAPPPPQSRAPSHSSRPAVAPVNTSAVPQSPRSAQTRSGDNAPQASRQQTLPSPHSSTSTTMPTSAILPRQGAQTYGIGAQTNFGYSSGPQPSHPASASTINIASSSTAPYAPPSNTQALLQGPTMPAAMVGPSLTDGPGLYSTTGFDMVGVLSRVAGRKDPKTVLGPVDLSCSFLVVDVRRYDSPIVYASPTFTSLTGYDLPQILGRNCRFLQSPEGEVVKGSKRKYTDNVAVAHLKRMLNAGKECQASLINYRRGGVPFINLVTVVPIPWDGTDIVYHVGFQVDLVEQPNAILRNMRDGSYQVNYTVANPPQPPLRPAAREGGVTGLNADVLEVLGGRVNSPSFGVGEDGGKMDWLKMVLENADDFVHVLSLKGLFQYVSPSVRRVLEYEPEDLLNKNISDICHPSDIVPLMRELKDSTHAPCEGQLARRVNLVFRIRRKLSGYIWIECTGRLHVEPGKGRKAVILSGRARSVPILPWDSVSRFGGLAETEFWAKLSHHGLVVHSTSGVSDVLGMTSDEVIGSSYFAYVPGGSNGPPFSALVEADPSNPVAQVSRAIQQAVAGETQNGAVSVRHSLLCRNGSTVDVVSVFYTARPVSTPDNDTPSSMSSSSSGASSDPRSPIIVLQVKLVSPTLTESVRPVVHAPSANVFEELETTRGTSWQYELHQMRLLNRRIREDIAAARARGGVGKAKAGKKRRMDGTGIDQSMVERFAAAPRHQLAPGFGLVPPGIHY